jgi:Uma2 family endonuclease
MSSAPKRKLTTAEYLEIERAAATDRSILWRGEMFAMGGASRAHNLITMKFARHIDVAFDGRECEVYSSDMRVKNQRSESYLYPDVVATSESPKFEDDTFDTLLNPQVIVEVLSKSTEHFDRGAKFEDYKQLASLKEYVLVAQDQMLVHCYTLETDSTWKYWSSNNHNDSLRLDSIDCTIALSKIYEKIDFDESDDADAQ